MSDNKKSNSNITYPPAAHIRPPRNPNVAVEYPKATNKHQSSDKASSLEWLKEADGHEAPTQEEGQVPKEDRKMKDSGGGGSLDWLVEAANYEPPEQPQKNTKD
ncbi:hypothetical protein CHU98_g3605 [Xylaria longipes]|nr:hypothetical protein CHU98_g3605 [Xylaria longipes]